MRLIVDENVPRFTVSLLREAGHDVLSIAETTPGVADPHILRIAVRETRILVTRDKKDFGALIYQYGLPPPPAVLLFRVADTGATAMATFISASIVTRDDWDGYFWVINESGARRRPLPG